MTAQERVNRRFKENVRTLVIGSKLHKKPFDRRDYYKNAIGLDMQSGDGVDIVHDLETPLIGHGLFDHIDCHSVLEHVSRPWVLCANIESIMDEGASIFVSVPFVWRVHGYPSDYWRMTKAALPILFPSIEWLDVDYVSYNRVVKKAAYHKTEAGDYLQRTETLGYGIKCATAS